MIKLYIVRHSKTLWNEQRLIQGRTDLDLSPLGISDAEKLKEQIDLNKIDICFCSPLLRAKSTAKIITDNKIDIIYDDLLIERDCGILEGTPSQNMDNLRRTWDLKLDDTSDNNEPLSSLLERARLFIEKLKNEYDGKSVLIVSHACLIKCIHFNLLGYDENTDFLSWYPDNACVYEYEIK
ncbi:MAG: histidine phosphatase family protein [Bacilli bacterium]|nr:histidine phosphatase family protein [Bacilli bacterium]